MKKSEIEKRKNRTKWENLLINICLSTFDIENIPDTINKSYLKDILLVDGSAVFFKDNEEKLRAYYVTQRGILDGYYTIKDNIVTNPIWGQYDLNENNSVIVYSDVSAELNQNNALSLVIKDTAELLSEIEKSIKCSVKNTRCIALIGASKDVEIETARNYIKQIYNEGVPVGIVEDSFIDKISVNPLYNTAVSQGINALVELQQYTLANFYNLIGLKAQNNFKKAQMSVAEINVLDDADRCSITHRLDMIEQGLKKVNEMFNTNMTLIRKIEEQQEEQKEQEEEEQEQEEEEEGEENESE